MKVFVVICRYEGCEEWCSSGAHVVGAFINEEKAKAVCDEHGKDEEAHLHLHFVDVVPCELDVTQSWIDSKGRKR